MLKVITTIVLLSISISASANESRYDDRHKMTKYSNHAYAEPSRKAQHNETPHRFKHSSFYGNPYYSKHAKFDHRSVQTNHGHHHLGKTAKSHKGLSQLKLHHVLPAHLTYGRLPMQVENRLGRLPSHLMRVSIGHDIAVIQIKNHIVHEIIRGLL